MTDKEYAEITKKLNCYKRKTSYKTNAMINDIIAEIGKGEIVPEKEPESTNPLDYDEVVTIGTSVPVFVVTTEGITFWDILFFFSNKKFFSLSGHPELISMHYGEDWIITRAVISADGKTWNVMRPSKTA